MPINLIKQKVLVSIVILLLTGLPKMKLEENKLGTVKFNFYLLKNETFYVNIQNHLLENAYLNIILLVLNDYYGDH